MSCNWRRGNECCTVPRKAKKEFNRQEDGEERKHKKQKKDKNGGEETGEEGILRGREKGTAGGGRQGSLTSFQSRSSHD